MINLAAIFTDGMTLQRQKPIKLWGDTDHHQTVDVILNGNTLVKDAEIEDAFMLVLPAQEAMSDAVLEIKNDEESVVIRNIDIGEVWIAGGQSNMEFLLRYDAEADQQIKNADDPHLRFYDVGEYTFDGEKESTHKDNCEGWDHWMPYTKDTAEYFSAVGVYFAKVLRSTYKVPVAIIGCNWGGTTASAWLDEKYLEDDPALHIYLEEYQKATHDLDEETYNRQHEEALAFLESKEMTEAMHGIMYGNVGLWGYIKAIPLLLKIGKTGMPIGPRYQNTPGVLYHKMLSQITGFSCRGFIWYQGESDDQKAEIYDRLFSAMIRCWRDSWNEELPFLFVQLAPFGKWLGNTGDKYPIVRQKQDLVSRTVKKTWMASIMDVGDKKDIHPKQKRPVGERLALLARGKVYGEDILCEAPQLQNVEVEDGRLLLRFQHAGEGLAIKGKKLNALEIITDKKKIVWKKAETSLDTLIIESDSISINAKLEIRYAWSAYCEANLYNSAGLCAKPFIWNSKRGMNECGH